MLKIVAGLAVLFALRRTYTRITSGEFGQKEIVLNDSFEKYHVCLKVKHPIYHQVHVLNLSRATLACNKYYGDAKHSSAVDPVVIVNSLYPIKCTINFHEQEEEVESRLEQVAKMFSSRPEPELHAMLDSAVVRLKEEMSKIK
jgi:hypothetical protein